MCYKAEPRLYDVLAWFGYIHAHPLLTALTKLLLLLATVVTICRTIVLAAIVVLNPYYSPLLLWVRRSTARPKVIHRREVALQLLRRPASRRGEMKPH